MLNKNTFLPFVTLVTRIRAAMCFEDAATAVLEPILDSAATALEHSAVVKNGRLLRAVVHLRHDEGYQRLFGIEYATRAELEAAGYLTSTRVWQWVAEHRCAISIDVALGVLVAHTPGGSLWPAGQ